MSLKTHNRLLSPYYNHYKEKKSEKKKPPFVV
jgi:hypothetical protein